MKGNERFSPEKRAYRFHCNTLTDGK